MIYSIKNSASTQITYDGSYLCGACQWLKQQQQTRTSVKRTVRATTTAAKKRPTHRRWRWSANGRPGTSPGWGCWRSRFQAASGGLPQWRRSWWRLAGWRTICCSCRNPALGRRRSWRCRRPRGTAPVCHASAWSAHDMGKIGSECCCCRVTCTTMVRKEEEEKEERKMKKTDSDDDDVFLRGFGGGRRKRKRRWWRRRTIMVTAVLGLYGGWGDEEEKGGGGEEERWLQWQLW